MKTLGFSLAAGLLAATLSAADLHVSSEGSCTDPYDSWEKASKTLSAAIASARPGDTVHIAEGVYSLASGETFPVVVADLSGVAFLGAPDGATVLDASGASSRVLQVSNSSDIVFRDLTITGARLEGATPASVSGAGVSLTMSGNITFERCEIVGNRFQATKNEAYSYGAGMNVVDSSVTIKGTRFCDNKGWKGCPYGMGLSIGENSSAAVIDTVFAHHKRTDSDPCYLVQGGAIAVVAPTASAALTNCLVYANDAAAGACYVRQGALSIDFCTIADNIGIGVKNERGRLAVRNSILYRNAGDLVGGGTITSCLVEDGDSGSLTADPLFVHGYRLAAGSPAIDAADLTAEAAALAGLTTSADSRLDAAMADLGYHAVPGAPLTTTDVFVSPVVGDDANDGLSPDRPLKTLAKALAVAPDHSAIHLADGLYDGETESFPVCVVGRDGLEISAANGAVLDAGGVTNVLEVFDSVDCLFKNLTMTGGELSIPCGEPSDVYAAGVFCRSSSAITFDSCKVERNYTERLGGVQRHVYGAGFTSLKSSGVHIVRSSITDNFVRQNLWGLAFGCGLSFVSSPYGTIRDSKIMRNGCLGVTSTTFGGGLYLVNALQFKRPVEIIRTTFKANASVTMDQKSSFFPTDGSAIYMGGVRGEDGGWLVVKDSLIADNIHSGIHVWRGKLVVQDSILRGNGDDVSGSVELVDTEIQEPSRKTTKALYVSLQGDDANDGLTAGTSLKTITRALGIAGDDTTIHVAPGVYDLASGETFPLECNGVANVRIQGAGQDVTKIDATGSDRRVFSTFLSSRCGLAGVTITGGHAMGSPHAYGGGIDVFASQAFEIADSAVVGNQVHALVEQSYGGGICARGASVTVTNSLVSGNIAGASPYTGNARGYGGGIALPVRDTVVNVYGSTISSNGFGPVYFERFGAGICAWGGDASLNVRSSLFDHNQADPTTRKDAWVGGIGNQRGKCLIENCTFAGNSDWAVNQYRNGKDGTITVRNSILWGNDAEVSPVVSITHSLVAGYTGAEPTVRSLDPLFVSPETGDYTIRTASPGRDAGVTEDWMRAAVDRQGHPRVVHRLVDLGCYENQTRDGTILFLR